MQTFMIFYFSIDFLFFPYYDNINIELLFTRF